MYNVKQDLTEYPPAKPNGDTNRSLTDIEIALAREFGFEKNIIVFNVVGQSWVLPLFHECDMVVVSPKSRLLSELEIKRTWQDFCADFKKRHHHGTSDAIEVSSFSYVIPEGLYEKAVRKLQEERIVVTSLITYDEQLRFRHHTCLYSFLPESEGQSYATNYSSVGKYNYKADEVKKGVEAGKYFKLDFTLDSKPTIIPKANARPLFTEQLLELARLGCMRQVSLRERISKLEETIKNNKQKMNLYKNISNIDANRLKAEIKRQIRLEELNFAALGGGGQTFCINTLEWVLKKIDSLQQEQSANMIRWTGNNLKEVIDFTGKSPRFEEWFKSWDEFESYVHSHGDILKLFAEDGSHFEVPVGAWIVKTPDGYNVPSVARFIHAKQEQPEGNLEKEFNDFLDNVEGMPRMWHSDEQIKWGKDIARHFYDLGLNARK